MASADAAQLLFAMQTYYAVVVRQTAARFGTPCTNPLPPSVFDWMNGTPTIAVRETFDKITGVVAGHCSPVVTNDSEACDLFKTLYQDLFPRALRHTLGEYYTPDWLAEHVLDQVGYQGNASERLLDPACGSGTFLILALQRLLKQLGTGGRAWGAGKQGLETRNWGLADAEHWPPTVDASAKVQMSKAEGFDWQSASHNPKSYISPAPRPTSPILPIAGFDLNPLAVLTARANVQITLAQQRPDVPSVHIPIYCRDSILDRGDGDEATAMPFDYVVGNPPWIAWDNLADDDRQATKPLWEKYGLFSLSGNEARHGGGKKDLSMLMLYTAADRYLKPGGQLSVVITQTLFQSARAGDGFRRFRLGDDGPPLRVLRVDDLVGIKAFDASNWTSVVTLEKGAATQYPVPYYKWERRDSADPPHPSSFRLHPCSASPVDPARPTSPWRIHDGGERDGPLSHWERVRVRAIEHRSDIPSPLAFLPKGEGTGDYTAYLGANSGGANGVFWIEVVRKTDNGILIRNITAKSKRQVAAVEQTIEADLLYPLLRWGDVSRYQATPRCHILLAQDIVKRSGIALEMMRQRFPQALAYLTQFQEMLETRAAYRRYQAAGPFYSMYNVGPYTVAPVKVVWRRMDRRINAAVVEPIDDPLLGLRPVLAQETCVIVPCETSDEAHYLCAMMNSAAMNEIVVAHSISGGKSFGTPGMMRYLPLQRFDPQNERHRELARLSREAHALMCCRPGDNASDSGESPACEVQARIDTLAALTRIYGSQYPAGIR